MGIALENIVYYKDETHYFVMTPKKQSLLEKGVLYQVPQTRRSSVISFLLLPSTCKLAQYRPFMTMHDFLIFYFYFMVPDIFL